MRLRTKNAMEGKREHYDIYWTISEGGTRGSADIRAMIFLIYTKGLLPSQRIQDPLQTSNSLHRL